MKIVIVTAILLGCTLFVFAQNDVQVDPLTGRAIYGIPVGQISVGSISAPIALAYDGGGVLVDSGDGTAGVGWNLVAGGSITRILRGLPDEYSSSLGRNGWLNSPNRLPLSSFSPSANYGCADWDSFDGFSDWNDTEPDLFVFNAPGLSGKFIYDNNGNIQLMPYQDVKITGDLANGFAITTNQGIIYTFSIKQTSTYESVAVDGPSPFDRRYNQFTLVDEFTKVFCTSVYYLSAITGIAGEQIYFDYGPETSDNSADFVRRVNPNLSDVSTYYYIYETSSNHRLLSISASNGVSSADISWAGNTVSRITLTQQNVTHTFTLGYTVVRNTSENSIENGASGTRNYLTSITEDSNCNPFPAYTFEYYSPELLPYKKEYPRDFFGYYNGASGDDTSLPVPSIYQNDNASNGERFRIYYKSGYATVSASNKRNVSADYVYYGSLKKINYPAGGYCQITYEPNQFYDVAAGTDQLGAGVRVSSIEMSDGDADNGNNIIRNYEYKKANGTSSGHWTYNPSFALKFNGDVVISPVNLAPEQEIVYDRSSVIYPGNGRTVSEFNVPFDSQTGVGGSPTTIRSVAVNSGTCLDTGDTSGLYIFPFAPNAISDFSMGQISRIQQLSQAGTVLKEQNYSYQTLNSSPVSIHGMKLDGSDIKYYGLYLFHANTGMTIQTESVTTYDMQTTSNALTSSTAYIYNGNNLLSEISVTNSDGKVSKVKNTYANDYNITSPSGANATMIKKLRDLNMHGTVVETVNLVDSYVTNANLNLFDDFSGSHVFAKQQLRYVGNGSFTYSSSSSPNTFSYDTAYVLQNTIENYNSIGLPLSTVSLDRSVAGVIYGSDKSTPVAMISGARGKEIVFSDFENNESYQMATNSSPTTPWTGTNAYLLSMGTNISKALVSKNGAAYYRFRCRTNASGSGNLTVDLSTSSGWNSTTINYGTSGQWVLLDAMIPMSSILDAFTLRLTANGSSVIIDDVAFYPQNASLQSLTYTPFSGKTSVTDNRGTSALYEYDAYGRLMVVRNSDKNVAQWHDYKYKLQPAPAIHCGFTSSIPSSLIVGTTITFTADDISCASGVSYVWKVNDVQVGTAPTLAYTFTEAKHYTISLTVSGSIGSTTVSSTAATDYLILPIPFRAVATGDTRTFDCVVTSDDGIRVLSVEASGLCSEGPLTYQWKISTDNGAFYPVSGGNGSTYTLDCNTLNQNAYFRCEIIYPCSGNSFWVPSNSVSIAIVQHDPACVK